MKGSIPKNKQEEQLFINPNNFYLKKFKRNKNKLMNIISSIIIIFLIIMAIIFYFIKNSSNKNITSKNNKNNNNNNKKENDSNKNVNNNIFIINNSSIVYNNSTINDPEFLKYKKMLPHLTPDLDINSSIEEIFNAREIYISDVRITPEYIKYIRPINETEEEKYKKPYSENETTIDRSLFPRRDDQYYYTYYCEKALAEKLLYERNITVDNKPLISVVVTTYNKKDILLKSIRSIQNQKFTNIEIIIVDDCSNDNSTYLFDYLLKTDPRIRIFHHMTNMGCWRSRLDGIIYSRGKYIILFDTGDLYEDNYVLLDAFNVIEKYNLDSCKFLFRIIRSFEKLHNSAVFFHVGINDKIVYGPENIYTLNYKVFTFWGNIWNRLVRCNIYTKALLTLNELALNIHKNTWDDVWINKIVHNVSYSYAVFERVGYVYLQNGYGEGSPNYIDEEHKSKSIKEYVGFLCFEHCFSGKNKTAKALIIKKLKEYNETHKDLRLQNFRAHFEVLNDLLKALIKDPLLSKKNKKFCKKLLNESLIREKEVKKNKSKKVKLYV